MLTLLKNLDNLGGTPVDFGKYFEIFHGVPFFFWLKSKPKLQKELHESYCYF